MGFIYNNVWESFCKTYLELNGYFVLNNVFVSLLDEEELDARRRRLEADLIAYKINNTNFGDYLVDATQHQQQAGEYFAGSNRENNLIYCEVRANISRNNDQASIASFFEHEHDLITRKFNRITERYGIQPTIVIMAYQISNPYKQQMVGLGWCYKEFPSMYQFMQRRFEGHAQEKRRVQYNDPWLEMLRFFDRLAYNHHN